MDPALLTLLKTQISQSGSNVGFRDGKPALDLPEAQAPANTWIWKSEFAVLALVPLASNDASNFRARTLEAKEWMWRFVKKSEDAGLFIDGYIAIAVSEKPDGELRSVVREVESDTSVCRKHVLWPVAGAWTERLQAITTLGLPNVVAATAAVSQPDLPVLAQRALLLYADRKSYEAVANTLKDEVEKAAINEVSDAD